LRADVLAVVTCTSKKSATPPSALTLRTVQGDSPSARADAWLKRLRAATTPAVPATELYAGDHWQVARAE
jgi:hypothetical protein